MLEESLEKIWRFFLREITVRATRTATRLQIVGKENKRTPFGKYIFHSSNFLFIGKVFSEAFLVAGHSISHCQFGSAKNIWSHAGPAHCSLLACARQCQVPKEALLSLAEDCSTIHIHSHTYIFCTPYLILTAFS